MNIIEKNIRDLIPYENNPRHNEKAVEAVRQIEKGTATRTRQDERFSTWEPSWERPRLKRNELIQIGSSD